MYVHSVTEYRTSGIHQTDYGAANRCKVFNMPFGRMGYS